MEAVTAAEAAVQAVWLSSHLHWQLEVIPLQSDLAEQGARQVLLEVLGLNQDLVRLESISVHLEVAEVHQTGWGLVVETEGAVEVVRQEHRVLAAMLVFPLRLE